MTEISKEKRDMTALYTPLAIVLAGALIGVGLMYGLKGNQPATGAAAAPTRPAVDIKAVKTEGEPYIGSVDAKVILAFWSDYQCPYCKAVEVGHPQIQTAPAIPDIIKNYVDTGKVKIVFKDFAFLGNDSLAAAEYGRAVWHLYPDQYFAWRTAMYKAQDDEGDTGFGNASTIEALIKKSFPKMDVVAIKADLSQNKSTYDADIQANAAEAQKLGFTGTPAFVTGKSAIDGAQPFSSFKAVIDPQLK